MNGSQPFGGWSPVLSGIIPSAPLPPRSWSRQRCCSSSVIPRCARTACVRATYDEVQAMIEERIAEAHALAYEGWVKWMERNL